MNAKIRIGAWQGPVTDNDFDANLEKARSVVRGSAGQLDFLCFPECFLSGYSERAIRESSVPLDDPRITDFVRFCGQYDTVVLVGMSERRPDGVYNVQLVTHQGRILGVSPKVMPTGFDFEHFRTDRSLPAYDAKGVKFGVCVCHTTSFVEPAQALRWKGARLLFTPHFNRIPAEGFEENGSRITFWEHRAMVLNNQAALATLLKMVVVRSNVTGCDETGLSSGDSAIWDMNGCAVASGIPFTECLATAEFDRGIFEKEHWIDRREVPVELLEEILLAARAYPR